MAKVKLDWFKLDCQMDDKVELIEAEFGLRGFAIVVKLLQKIYGGEGYYCEWNNDVALVFAKKNNVGVNVVSEIVSAAIRRGIFDSVLYEKFGILTSHGIQSRYFDIADRRKGKISHPEYLLVQCAQNSDNADISSKNVNISEENADISSQKREEEKRTEKKRRDKKREETQKTAYGSHGKVLLTGSEYAELVSMSSSSVVDKYILKLDNWASENNKPIKNAFTEIKKWIVDDGRGTTQRKSETSYDLDRWRDTAVSFNPNDLSFDDEEEDLFDKIKN